MASKLYAFDGPEAIFDGDPHAIQIVLSETDATKWRKHKLAENDLYLGRWDVGTWLSVVDADTGDHWRIATAPCGQGCRCAAVAVRA